MFCRHPRRFSALPRCPINPLRPATICAWQARLGIQPQVWLCWVMRIHLIVAALCSVSLPLTALAADPPKPAAKEDTTPKALGGVKGWTAYSAGDKNTLVCYVVGKPAKS